VRVSVRVCAGAYGWMAGVVQTGGGGGTPYCDENCTIEVQHQPLTD
jgi:hypothetical protein